MDYQDAINKLWNHANLPEKGLKREESFIYTAWQTEKSKSPQDFQRLYEDILSCLAIVNSTLNGSVPSETIVAEPQPIDRTLCYCVSGILSSGWSHYFHWVQAGLFPAEYTQRFASMLVRIAIAWDFVLAGDMDNIPEDTEREFTMQQT